MTLSARVALSADQQPSSAARLLALAVASASIALAGCGSTAKNETANATAERIYKDAKDDAESGSYERAIKQLERVEGLAAGTLLAQQAQLDLAYLQWRSAEREQAITTVNRFIKLNPSSPALDYAFYLRGVINFNDNLGLLGTLAGQDLSERDQRAAREAFQSFKRLVEQFPQSRYAADSRLRMDYIVNSLASYEVHVARYYLRRGAYVAAANRAQTAVTEFPQSPAVEEALAIMVQSYEKLDMASLRDGADRVLRKNFPDSRFVAGNSAGKGVWWKFWQ